MDGNSKQKLTFSEKFIRFFDRWTPNSMVFAYLLTVIVAILVLIFTDTPVLFNSPDGHVSLVNAWVQGFWNLLTFAMQMSLIMITGSVVATSPPIKKLLKKLAQIPNNAFGAFALLITISWILTWIHWGVGMMVSINLGREILAAAKDKGYPVHSHLIIATSYCTAIGGVGISQAAPLLGATQGYLKTLVTEETAAYIPDVVPMAESVLSPVNLIQCVVIFVIIFAVGWAMHPKKDKVTQCVGISDELYNEMKAIDASTSVARKKASSPAEWINNSPLLSILIGAFGLFWIIRLLIVDGFINISIDNFNFLLLMLGVVLCRDPETFCKGVMNAVSSVWGVIIQFPFYAGIFGLIAYTGFSEVLVDFFLSFATKETFPVITYIYSAILNMAVPSGGSKFAIEAPYLLDICAKLDVDIGQILCSYTYGDQTTNIIQPFWALPYLGLYKVDFKHLLPYTFVICIVSLIVCIIFTGFIYNIV